MFRKIISIIIVVISLCCVLLPRTAHGYEWHSIERLTTSTQRYSIGFMCSSAGEQVYIIPIEVYTKFFQRSQVSNEKVIFSVRYFELSSNQRFEDVSHNFSNGSCQLTSTITNVETFIKLEPPPLGGKKQVYAKITLNGPRGESLYLISGPPI